MQPHPNNDLRRVPSEKGKGFAGTAILHIGLFLLLIFVGFAAPKPPDTEKGILVNFGNDETGAGLIEPSPSQSNEETTTPQKIVAEKPQKEDAVITQNFDKEAPEVRKVDPEAEKRKKELIEAEKIKKAELEAERKRKAQVEAEKKRVEQEQKRANAAVNRTKNAFPNAKNSGTTSAGEGITGGTGNQGDLNGSVDSKVRGTGIGTDTSGVSYDLAGRNFQSLPNPKYEYQGEGRVVVDISVDRNGNVIQAVPGAKGSTTLDDYLLSTAKEAALKSKFEPKADAPSVQKGTITYNFILR